MALSLQRYTMSDHDSRLFRILKERIQSEREKFMVIEIKSKDFLTESLMIEILSWLPVKALLQFKSVCKSWYAIISSPDFIFKHLKNYYNNSDSDCLLAQYYVSHAELQVFELLIDETETPQVLAREVLYDMPMYGSYICGPCNGLYYLYVYDYAQRALWNPAINEHKCLPPIITKPDLPSKLTPANSEVYGFGYDTLKDDYKVVVIKGYWSNTDDDDNDESEITHPPSVFVCSLSTDAWRYCGDLGQNYDLESSKCYTYVNGCYYWLGSRAQDENSLVIICFDMSTDTFEEINVPNFDQPASKSLGIYDDSLAFLTVHDNEKHFDVWTLNEGLWTKKLNMGSLTNARNPVGHWKKNKVLLEGDVSELVMCDLKTQETKRLAFQRSTWCEGVYDYKESLVSVKDRNRWGAHQETEIDDNQV